MNLDACRVTDFYVNLGAKTRLPKRYISTMKLKNDIVSIRSLKIKWLEVLFNFRFVDSLKLEYRVIKLECHRSNKLTNISSYNWPSFHHARWRDCLSVRVWPSNSLVEPRPPSHNWAIFSSTFYPSANYNHSTRVPQGFSMRSYI